MSKYEVASFQDVFCEPFYWQLFSLLERPPARIVDCGAHCGHFTALAETCVLTRFGRSDARYVLVEPNPGLQASLQRTLSDVGLENRSEIHQAVVGAAGSTSLWVNNKNFLAASLSRPALGRARAVSVKSIDISALLPAEPIDVLKLDIEGSEHAFVEMNGPLLSRTEIVLMEIHGGDEERNRLLLSRMHDAGHEVVGGLLPWKGNALAAFRRTRAAHACE